MSRIVIALCAFLLLAIAPSVKADPIVITGGTLTVTGAIPGGPRFTLTGDNFSVSGGGEQGSSPSCFPCRSGDFISVGGFFAGSSLRSGTVIVDGMTFSGLMSGQLVFTGPPILIPEAMTNISISGPFTMRGFINVCAFKPIPSLPDCGGNDVLFTTDLVGQGIVTINLTFLRILNGRPLFQMSSVTYTFQEAEIPEPMTITLLTLGVIGLGAKRAYKQRRGRKAPLS
jgi:hypothetical protein